jgi:hypothetical protein
MDIATSYQPKVYSKFFDSNFGQFLHCNLHDRSGWVHLRTLQSLDVDFKHCIVFCVTFQIRWIVHSRTKFQWWVIKISMWRIFWNPSYGHPWTILKTISKITNSFSTLTISCFFNNHFLFLLTFLITTSLYNYIVLSPHVPPWYIY